MHRGVIPRQFLEIWANLKKVSEIKPPLKYTLIWLQIFLEDADKANSTGWVISKIVWNKEAATINRMIDIAPNLLEQYS